MNLFRYRLPLSRPNILTGQEVVIDEGDMIEAIRASISIPGILTPVSRDGAILVDGGLVDPVPVHVAGGWARIS